jgi:hypothetical protein
MLLQENPILIFIYKKLLQLFAIPFSWRVFYRLAIATCTALEAT